MNQLISDGESTYTYDKLGNLTSINKNGTEERTLSYDGMGMLAELSQNGEFIQKLLCNGMGNRIGNASISYGIDYAAPYRRILTEREHGSANSAYHNYLWQDDTFIGLPEEGIHVLTDFFHSPVRVTDKAGTTQNIYQYDEFGGVTQKEETLPIPFAFTGYVKEPWEEMYYTGSRAYNAKTGRFQSKDQYRYMDYQNPLSMNLYQYAKGNPLHYLDFDGHDSIGEKSYLERSIEMVLLGNFSEEVTLLGLVVGVGLGIFGLDLIQDGRDLIADLTANFDSFSWQWLGIVLLDLAAFVPIIGTFKYLDEAGTLLKYADEGAEVVSHADETAKATQKVVQTVTENTDETAAAAKKTVGESFEGGNKTAKEIIGDRVHGFDLEAHPTSNKQLSSSKMKELKNKIDSRTATREEYNLYEWNKK